MAEAFEISGPTDVLLKVRSGAYVALGRSDGEERIAFETEILSRQVSADEDGLVASEIIHLGMRGILTMQLVKWDRDLLNDLWGCIPRAAATTSVDLTTGDIGRLWGTATTGVGFFGIQIKPDLTDVRVIRSFEKCWMDGNAIRETEIGNDKTVLQLAFQVLPDSGTLYAKTTTAPA